MFGKHPEKPLPQGVVKFFIKEGFEMPFLFLSKSFLLFTYINLRKNLRLNITSVIFKKIRKKGEIKLYEKNERKKHTKTITKIVLFSGILIGGEIGIVTIMNRNVPEKRLMEYMKYIEKGEYEQMYAMLDQKKSSMNSKEEFIERNSKNI